ncbi:MAG: DEAD/DEAH box helicase [Candidatus Woesearchaeota archaeon]
MRYKNFKLDDFQEDSIKSLNKDNSVIVSAPTGSGKTLIADYLISKAIENNQDVIYTSPIKALSNQKFKEFRNDFGKEKVGLMTGDVVKNPDAQLLIMTTEIYRNMCVQQDYKINHIKYVIFDEIHFINDRERGYIWEESIIFSKNKTRFLCLSATIPNAKEFAGWISKIKGHEVDVIKQTKRPVPLHKKFYYPNLGISNLDKIKDVHDIPYRSKRGRKNKKKRTLRPKHYNLIRDINDKTPILFFTFSKKKCHKHAVELSKKNIFRKDTEALMLFEKRLREIPSKIKQMKTVRALKKTLPYGIGFHHAGILPLVKEIIEELFEKGLIKVLYTTETFAVGINMPAKTVCFDSLMKFDGINFRLLNSKEFFQIAGRAGRRGIDKEGFVYVMLDKRDDNFSKIRSITDKDMKPIKSQFQLSVNTVLNLIKNHDENSIKKILNENFFTYQKFGDDLDTSKRNVVHRQFNNIKKKLIKKSFIDKNDNLTHKGEFASKIYSDVIITSEMFATNFVKHINDYQIILLLASLSYEPRDKDKFYKTYKSNYLSDLYSMISNNRFLWKSKRFKSLKQMTALVHPIYSDEDIFRAIKNTNIMEGNVIRIYRQILDRINQIENPDLDHETHEKLDIAREKILNFLEEIDEHEE